MVNVLSAQLVLTNGTSLIPYPYPHQNFLPERHFNAVPIIIEEIGNSNEEFDPVIAKSMETYGYTRRGNLEIQNQKGQFVDGYF